MSKRTAKSKQEKVKNLSIVSQPGDFFKEQLTKAIERQKVRIDLNTEFYLVDLLTRFMFAENLFVKDESGAQREETLALLFQEAMAADDINRKRQGLKRLGDVSLYTAGFFSDYLSQKSWMLITILEWDEMRTEIWLELVPAHRFNKCLLSWQLAFTNAWMFLLKLVKAFQLKMPKTFSTIRALVKDSQRKRRKKFKRGWDYSQRSC